jgi:hypothetical protein
VACGLHSVCPADSRQREMKSASPKTKFQVRRKSDGYARRSYQQPRTHPGSRYPLRLHGTRQLPRILRGLSFSRPYCQESKRRSRCEECRHARMRALSKPDVSPHVSVVDMGGHGYSVVRVTSESFETEFVCIPRPLERSERADGGPSRIYRIQSRTLLLSGSPLATPYG